MEPEIDAAYPDEYSPYIRDYPYTGWNNVLGGGGRNQGQDIYVPPQVNLYSAVPNVPSTKTGIGPIAKYGVGIQNLPLVGQYLAIPTLALIVGLVLGYVLRPKVEPKLKKFEAEMFEE